MFHPRIFWFIKLVDSLCLVEGIKEVEHKGGLGLNNTGLYVWCKRKG